MKNLQRLQNALEQFIPANTINELTKQFKDIAQIVFNGRYVVMVNTRFIQSILNSTSMMKRIKASLSLECIIKEMSLISL